MADATRQVTFDILARDRASRPLRNIGDNANRASDRFKRFGKVAARAGKVAAFALGGAAVVITRGLIDAAKAAADEEQEMATLRRTLKKAGKATDAQADSTEKWITKLQNATGVADGDLRPALGKLVIATGDVNDAQKLLAQALDIAAARGKPLNTVVEALGKGALGTTGGLARLGLATKDASGKALTFDQILQNASKTMGGAAATAADTTTGRFAILRAEFQDVKEEIGKALLPILDKLGRWFLDKGLPALKKFGGWVRDDLWPVLKDFGSAVGEGVIGFFSNLGDALGKSDDGAANFKSTIKGFGDTLTKVVLPAVGKFVEHTLPALGTIMGKQIGLQLDLAQAMVDMALVGVRSFGALVRAALSALGAIVHAMDKVRFLFPAISGKIHEAAGNFDTFRSRTLKNLKRTEDGLVAVKEALANIRSKSITVAVDYAPSGIPGKFAGKPVPLASGGQMRAGRPYWVGEEGPELVTPTRNGWVNDASKSAAMTGSGGGITIENLNVTSGPGEHAEQSVPRALRRVVWAF